MSCYLRHLKDLLAEAGTEATSDSNRHDSSSPDILAAICSMKTLVET